MSNRVSLQGLSLSNRLSRPGLRSVAALLGAALLFTVPACGEDAGPVVDEESEEFAGKDDAWDAANNPARIDGTFVYDALALPIEGAPKLPITPSDYWASYEDSINRRWDGETSLAPSEKYAKVFGGDAAAFQKAISQERGALSNSKECKDDTECDKDYGEVCSRPRGVATTDKGRCIGTWWGSCPGWAAWSILDPAPINPVTRKAADGTDVTFYPADIEALQTFLWDVNTSSKFLSQRCNTKDVPTDLAGRQVSGECRDMNPGSFHVLAANMLGLRQTSFVYDRTANYEVWNQPVAGFRVTNATPDGKLKEITLAQAITLLGLDFKATEVLKDKDVNKAVAMMGTTPPVAANELTGIIKVKANEKTRIVMSGTGDADLYVRKEKAPTDSEYDCRPYQGGSNEECLVESATDVDVHYRVVPYAEKSKVTLATSIPLAAGAATYKFNTFAKRFFEVETDFSYISESKPSRESQLPNVGRYTKVDHYHYILEADKDGRILGGEWLGESRTAHPDFLWYPTNKPFAPKGNGLLTYARVKELLDAAVTPATTQPQATESKLLENKKVYTSASAYVTVGVPAGGKLELTMTGDNDADLYVRLGRKPTVTSFDCKSTTLGVSAETCTLTAGPEGGTYYVRAKANRVAATVTVTAKVTPAP